MRRIAATSRPERSATSRTERVAPRLRTRSAASPSTCWSRANASIWWAVAPCATSHARSAASCFSTGPPASSIDTHATAAGGPRVAGDRSARRAQRLDQLALVHGRPAGDAEVAGPLHQVVLGPVVVGRLLGTLALGTLAGVGDACRLALAHARCAHLLVLTGVLDARTMAAATRHRHHLPVSVPPRYVPSAPGRHTRNRPARSRAAERRGWDLNPRRTCALTSLAGKRLRPDSATSPRGANEPSRPRRAASGAGGIRTHGPRRVGGFQDHCLRPLGHRSSRGGERPGPATPAPTGCCR